VPVVEVQHIGRILLDEGGEGAGEPEEPLAVVGPAFAVRLQVGMGPLHARHRHQMQAPHVGMVSRPDRRCSDPRRNVEGGHGLVGQSDVAVVGHHQIEIDTQPAQLGAESRCCGSEPAHGGNRGQLGGGEDDAHVTSVAHHGVADPGFLAVPVRLD
jgi:hypothetical protein